MIILEEVKRTNKELKFKELISLESLTKLFIDNYGTDHNIFGYYYNIYNVNNNKKYGGRKIPNDSYHLYDRTKYSLSFGYDIIQDKLTTDCKIGQVAFYKSYNWSDFIVTEEEFEAFYRKANDEFDIQKYDIKREYYVNARVSAYIISKILNEVYYDKLVSKSLKISLMDSEDNLNDIVKEIMGCSITFEDISPKTILFVYEDLRLYYKINKRDIVFTEEDHQRINKESFNRIINSNTLPDNFKIMKQFLKREDKIFIAINALLNPMIEAFDNKDYDYVNSRKKMFSAMFLDFQVYSDKDVKSLYEQLVKSAYNNQDRSTSDFMLKLYLNDLINSNPKIIKDDFNIIINNILKDYDDRSSFSFVNKHYFDDAEKVIYSSARLIIKEMVKYGATDSLIQVNKILKAAIEEDKVYLTNSEYKHFTKFKEAIIDTYSFDERGVRILNAIKCLDYDIEPSENNYEVEFVNNKKD